MMATAGLSQEPPFLTTALYNFRKGFMQQSTCLCQDAWDYIQHPSFCSDFTKKQNLLHLYASKLLISFKKISSGAEQFREYSLKVTWVRKINGELQRQPLSLVSVLLPSISQYIKALLENLIRIPLTTEKWVNNFGPVIALCGLRVNKLWFAFQSQNHFYCSWPTIHNRTHSAFLSYTASAIINS